MVFKPLGISREKSDEENAISIQSPQSTTEDSRGSLRKRESNIFSILWWSAEKQFQKSKKKLCQEAVEQRQGKQASKVT